MELGLSPYAPVAVPGALRLHAAMAAFAEMLLPLRREFLTVAASKDLR